MFPDSCRAAANLSSSICCSMFLPPAPVAYAERLGWYSFRRPVSETEGGASVVVGRMTDGSLSRSSSSSVLALPASKRGIILAICSSKRHSCELCNTECVVGNAYHHQDHLLYSPYVADCRWIPASILCMLTQELKGVHRHQLCWRIRGGNWN